MNDVRTRRRRVRQVHPEVLTAIRQALLTGASAPQVVRALSEMQRAGKVPAGSIPSERTVSNIAREMRQDESEAWSLVDGTPESVTVVLEVLAEVVGRTEGRVTSLTKEQAALVPLMYAAMAQRFRDWGDARRRWQAYVWTRFYLSWVRSEADARDAALLLAAMQTDDPWPANAWRNIERVNDAMAGWLPPDMREVAR